MWRTHKQLHKSAFSLGRTLIVESSQTKKSTIAYTRFYPSVDIDDEPARVATIKSLYVLPSFQRQGVGRELMEAILKVAKAEFFEELTLHVLAANERARKFYEELDWTQDVNPNIKNSEGDLAPKVRYRMKEI